MTLRNPRDPGRTASRQSRTRQVDRDGREVRRGAELPADDPHPHWVPGNHPPQFLQHCPDVKKIQSQMLHIVGPCALHRVGP